MLIQNRKNSLLSNIFHLAIQFLVSWEFVVAISRIIGIETPNVVIEVILYISIAVIMALLFFLLYKHHNLKANKVFFTIAIFSSFLNILGVAGTICNYIVDASRNIYDPRLDIFNAYSPLLFLMPIITYFFAFTNKKVFNVLAFIQISIAVAVIIYSIAF